MSWVRRDDQASIHRKVAPLDDATYRLWSEAIEWCSRNGTDGVIRADELGEVSKRASPARAAKLVERDLWHTADVLCGSERCTMPGSDGWVVHDYLDYNPSRAQVVAEKKAKAERTARWREKRRGRDASRDGPQDASQDAPVMLPRPVPSRPAPKEAGAGPPKPPPAAAGDGAAAGGGQPNSPLCPTCGNTTTSAYHRRVCGAEMGAA